MTKHLRRITLALLALIYTSLSMADNLRISNAPKSWKAECASCHTAYPPSLLTANDWRSVMASLNKHYGSDASMADTDVTEISRFLVNHASTQTKHASPVNPPRMTQTAWFERKHRKVPEAAWTDLRIKSASNCAACHTQSAKDSYSEREISVPGYPGKHW
jgi:cytochrome c553